MRMNIKWGKHYYNLFIQVAVKFCRYVDLQCIILGFVTHVVVPVNYIKLRLWKIAFSLGLKWSKSGPGLKNNINALPHFNTSNVYCVYNGGLQGFFISTPSVYWAPADAPRANNLNNFNVWSLLFWFYLTLFEMFNTVMISWDTRFLGKQYRM